MTTLKAAARRYGLVYPTLRLWAAKANLPAMRVGHYLLYDSEAVDRLIAGHRRPLVA
jgi:hypothetical protein